MKDALDNSIDSIVQDVLRNEEGNRQRQTGELQAKNLKNDLASLIVTITRLLPCWDPLEELFNEINNGHFQAFFTTLCAYLIYFIDRLNQSQALPMFDKDIKEILMHYNKQVLQCEITDEDAKSVGLDRKTYIESLLDGKAKHDLPREICVYRVIVNHLDSIHKKIKLQNNQVKELAQLNSNLFSKGSGLTLNRLKHWPSVEEIIKFINEREEKFKLHEPKKFRQETLRSYKEKKFEQFRQKNAREEKVFECRREAFFNPKNIRLLSVKEKEIHGKSHEDITNILKAISRYPFHLLSNLLGYKFSQTPIKTITEPNKLIKKDPDHVGPKENRTGDQGTENFCL